MIYETSRTHNKTSFSCALIALIITLLVERAARRCWRLIDSITSKNRTHKLTKERQ